MVMVLRPAANVGGASGAGERVHGACTAEQLDRPVRRGEPESRVRSTGGVEDLDHREGAAPRLDGVHDGAAGRRHPRPRREGDAAHRAQPT